MDNLPPGGGRSRGKSILFLAVLLALIVVLVGWGWLASPPDAPQPAATGVPPTMPTG